MSFNWLGQGRAGLAAVFLSLGGLAQPALATHDTEPGMVQHETSNALGSMTYSVYVPTGLKGRVPLFVHIHGGNFGAEDSAHRSRLNELAAARGFVVVYPQEDPSQNAGIWNDAEAAEIGRDYRASALIAQVVREVMADQPIDPRRVFIGGISAGASMSIAVAAQYPDLFTGLHIEAGDPYGEDSVEEAGRQVYEVMGPRARRVPLMLSYGTLDPFAWGGAAENALKHWLIAMDWVDDGAANGSVSLMPSATRTGTDGKSYTVDTYVDAQGCVLAERWLINGLFHAYSGGGQLYPLVDVVADPNAPNMREIAYDFFLDQYDANGPPGCPKAANPDSGSGGGSPAPWALVLLLGLAALRRLARLRR